MKELFTLKNGSYDKLKKLLTLYIPALCTLIYSIDAIWGIGLPVDKIVETITAICTFLGVIFNISCHYYNEAEDEEH